MIVLNEAQRYVIRNEVCIEDFNDGSLIFLSRQKKIFAINSSARQILSLLSEKRDLGQVIIKFARDHKIQIKNARIDVNNLVANLILKKAIRVSPKMTLKKRNGINKLPNFLASPDVLILKEKDRTLLYKADANVLQVINSIGLIIWEYIKDIPRTQSEIVSHIKEFCGEVPHNQVEVDVAKFISDLKVKKFIEEVFENK